MSNELFDVVFFGILQAGKDKETVMQNMAALFKTDASKLAPYFSGGRKVIKGKLNAAAAEKYKAALENVGLSIKIEPCADSTDAAPNQAGEKSNTKAKDKTTAAAIIDTGDMSIAPIGSDVMEHSAAVETQKIEDISDISMAETGANVIENPVVVAPQKIDDISDISMAEVGTDVLDRPSEIIPQKIDDISDISLAEAGSDLIANPKPVKKADIPDTSELTLDD